MPKEKTKKAKDLLNPPEKTIEDLEEIWREIIRSHRPIEEGDYQEEWKMWKKPICPDDNWDMWQNSDEKYEPIKEVDEYIWPKQKQKKQKPY